MMGLNNHARVPEGRVRKRTREDMVFCPGDRRKLSHVAPWAAQPHLVRGCAPSGLPRSLCRRSPGRSAAHLLLCHPPAALPWPPCLWPEGRRSDPTLHGLSPRFRAIIHHSLLPGQSANSSKCLVTCSGIIIKPFSFSRCPQENGFQLPEHDLQLFFPTWRAKRSPSFGWRPPSPVPHALCDLATLATLSEHGSWFTA